MLRNLASIAPSTALSRSASSKTMNGAHPPSSIEVRSTLSAEVRSSDRPTAVEPVNDSLRNRRSASNGSVTAPADAVGTTLTTPAGTPTSSSTRASASEVSGVSAAGLSTTVQPAARAGAIFRVAIASGKFQGVMNRQGPTGRRTVRRRRFPSGEAA